MTTGTVFALLFAAYTIVIARQARVALRTPDPLDQRRQARLLLIEVSFGFVLLAALIVIAI